MTTKGTANPPREAKQPSQEEMQAAYQIHTLARMMYGQLAVQYPWLASTPQMAATTGFTPVVGFQTAPFAQSWPGIYGQPGYPMEMGPVNPLFTGPVCRFGS